MQGVSYSQSMRTGWKLPARVRKLSEEQRQAIRDKFHIIVEGSNLQPPVTAFEDLKLPRCILDTFKAKGITRPTPIQMQVCSSLFQIKPAPLENVWSKHPWMLSVTVIIVVCVWCV